MKASFRLMVSITLVALVLSACGGGSSGDVLRLPANDQTTLAVNGMPPAVPATPLAMDNFAFRIDEQFIVDQPEIIVEPIQRDIGAAVDPINRVDNVLSNNTVSVTYGFCNVANAFYSPATREIFLCHELSVAAFDFFLDGGSTDAEVETAFSFALQAMIHVMYHEMGHALDDLTGINVGGNFESVADAIAVVLAMQTGQPLVAALGGSFTLASGDSSLFGEHGSGVDRAGDILCWAVGGSPSLATTLTELSANFVQAGRDCVAEYANQYAFVETLIPELRNIPAVGSTRSKHSQVQRSVMMELDRRMAVALRTMSLSP